MQLKGKTAAIIGGGGGIGRSIALALAREGVDVLVGDIDPRAASAVAAEVEAIGRKGVSAQCDLGTDVSVEAFADLAFATFGRVDLLFNHAGASVAGLLEEISSDDWAWILNINIAGLGRSIRCFLPRMTAQGGGQIINTSSGLGLFQSLALAAPYSATKAAIIAYSRSLAVYARNRRIQVSVFCPDITRTAFVASGRLVGMPPALVAGILPGGDMQTADEAAACLLSGMRAGDFLISAMPGTGEKLRAMAAGMLAPGSDNWSNGRAGAPIVQRGSIRVPPGRRDQAIAAYAEFVAASRSHAGCLVYDAVIDIEDSCVIRIFEVWQDASAIDSHACAPETIAFIARIVELGASEFKLDRPAG